MALTREFLNQGMTYDEYRGKLTRNHERFAANEVELQLESDDLTAIRNLPKTVDVLVIAEDWCGDVVANLPILARLARESGKLNLHIFQRDQHPDLMDQYLNEGKYRSIPVFVFLDQSLKEVGRFIERPQSVTDLRAKRRAEIYASDPAYGSPDAPADQLPEEVRARLTTAIAAMRDETKPFADGEVVRVIRGIVEPLARG